MCIVCEAGHASYDLGMAATSTRLRDVYAFRQKDLDAFPVHEQVWLVEAGDDYIPRGGWTGSPEQLATMISYPAEKLQVTKLARAV